MSADLRDLKPWLRPYAQAFVRYLSRAGVAVIVTSTVRSRARQRRLYSRYLRGDSPLPAAPPGHSTHEQGIAFDLNLNPPVYRAAGRLWESIGGTWGGRFNDPVHFDAR